MNPAHSHAVAQACAVLAVLVFFALAGMAVRRRSRATLRQAAARMPSTSQQGMRRQSLEAYERELRHLRALRRDLLADNPAPGWYDRVRLGYIDSDIETVKDWIRDLRSGRR